MGYNLCSDKQQVIGPRGCGLCKIKVKMAVMMVELNFLSYYKTYFYEIPPFPKHFLLLVSTMGE